jgi:hypothetical protein
MSRRFLSAGVRALNLPSSALDAMQKTAIDAKPSGPERVFYYVPMACVMPEKNTPELVVSVFLKPLRQGNIHAQRGDVAFTLRTEWNEHENPVG